MNQILNFTEAANLGVHALAFMARHPHGKRFSAELVGTSLRVSVSHMSKVLQRLARRGLVASTRGAHGGFVLARTAQEINLFDIIDALDAMPEAPKCLLGRPICAEEDCTLRDLSLEVQNVVRTRLTALSLAEFSARIKLPAPR